VLIDISNESYSLLDSDSTSVEFPGDYKGDISVISFIFTNCPDVCPIITANMSNIQRELEDTSGVNFIEISFDPERDTPSALKDYKKAYKLNDQFSLLTGDSKTIDPLLDRLEIYAEKIYPDSLVQDSSEYTIRHSNTLYLMDQQGRIRAEYPAHAVPPKHIVEDIQYLR
jgi:protein SCO1/2